MYFSISSFRHPRHAIPLVSEQQRKNKMTEHVSLKLSNIEARHGQKFPFPRSDSANRESNQGNETVPSP